MKIEKPLIFSFAAPIMIGISTIGLVFRNENTKIFYLPIGLMGVVIILEKDISRKVNRQIS